MWRYACEIDGFFGVLELNIHIRKYILVKYSYILVNIRNYGKCFSLYKYMIFLSFFMTDRVAIDPSVYSRRNMTSSSFPLFVHFTLSFRDLWAVKIIALSKGHVVQHVQLLNSRIGYFFLSLCNFLLQSANVHRIITAEILRRTQLSCAEE